MKPAKKARRPMKGDSVKRPKAPDVAIPLGHPAFERARILYDLQVHQVELETQNRELRETHRLLELSRDRYADLYDFAPVGYVTLDDKGLIHEINLTAAGMLNVERSRLIGLPFALHVVKDDLPAFREHLRNVARTKEPAASELRLNTKGGGTIQIGLQTVPVLDTGRKTRLTRSTLTDITRRKSAEALLRSTQERLELALAGAELGLWDRDLRGDKLVLNPRWAEMLGYTVEQVSAEGFSWASMVHPEDLPRLNEAIEAHLAGQTPMCEVDYRVRAQSGEWRWVLSRGKVVARDPAGRPVRMAGTYLDIQVRKQAAEALRNNEARLSAILDNAVEGIITIDERGIIESFNPAAERIFGYKAKEAIGRNVNFLMPAPYHEEHDGYLDHYRRTREPKIIGSGREVAGRRKNGEIFPLDLSVSEVPLTGRRIFTGFVRDITRRKHLEKEVLEATEREQNRIGQDLHDGLCQHLAGIEFRLLGLKQKLEGKSNKQAAETIELAKLIRQGIEQTHTLALGLSPVMLEAGGLMKALQELALSTEKAFKISCALNCPGSVLIHDNSVATHLYRIAQEAVHNAVRHGKAKFIVINLLAENDRIVLGVKDDGVGFPKKPHPHNGMGLRIMQYRAGMIGGSFAVQHEPEGGTSIICSLREDRSRQESQLRRKP